MFITKKNTNKNEYVQTSTGLWVRNYNQNNVVKYDLNEISSKSDYRKFIDNQNTLKSLKLLDIESEIKYYNKCLIISDGYDFEKATKILPSIPKDVLIIGTNRTLARWKQNGELIKRKMNYFIMNNPYPEATMFFPSKHKYMPKCIVSMRSSPEFVKKYLKYQNSVYQYTPVYNKNFSGDTKYSTQLDDYRNPICAAISFAYKLGVSKLGLLCCDASFNVDHPGSEVVKENVWSYPQHKISHSLIEGCLYWFKRQEDRDVEIVNCSQSYPYQEIEDIEMDDLIEFFN